MLHSQATAAAGTASLPPGIPERRRAPRPPNSAWPQALPRNQDRAEVRLLAASLTGVFIYFTLEPALYAGSVEESVLARVLALTGHAGWWLAALYLCMAMLVPHFVSLLVMPRFLECRTPRVLATYGAMAGGLLWFVFADLARPLDVGPLPYLFGARAVVNVLVAGIFAFSLNSQQLREMLHVRSTA